MLAFFCFLGFSLLWFWREAFLNYLFCFSDLTYYFYPYRYFMAEVVKAGAIPLWNPYILMGFPFLAALQPGLFYPFSIFYYLFPFDAAFNWFLILHFPAGAIFMYLLCRELRVSSLAAFSSGLVFAFSGYTLSVLHMPTSLSAVIWLPLVFLFFRRAVRPAAIKQRIKNTLLTAIFLALMFLGGEPTILYGTIWILFGYLLFFYFGRWKEWRDFGSGLLLLAFSALLAAALTSIQLLPFLELLGHSSRRGGITFAEASRFSLPPRKLIELVFPYFYHLSKFPWLEVSWAKFPYLGFVPAVLALFSFFLHKDRCIWWLGGLMLFIMLMVMGAHSPIPVYFLLYKFIPGFNLFRYPIKFIFVLVFIFSFLSGLGVDLLWSHLPKMKRTLIGLFLISAAAMVLFLIMYFKGHLIFGILRPLFSAEIRLIGEKIIREQIIPRNVANFGILICLLLILTLWMTAACFRKIRKEFFGIGLIFLVFLDLYTAVAGANFSIKAESYKVKPANIKILKRDKTLFRYIVSPHILKRSYIEVGAHFEDYRRALISSRNRLTANQNMLYSLSHSDGYESIRGADQDKLLHRIYNLNTPEGMGVLNMLNVKYLVTPWEFKQKGFELVSREKETCGKGAIFLYRNRNVLPRAFLVPKAKFMGNREKILDYIFSRGFDPLKEVVLEGGEEGRGVGEAGRGSIPEESARIMRYRPDQVEIEVFSKRPAYLFLSDWFYPGWKAYRDGKEVKIYRANYMFRAVAVPSGKHMVRFVYDPLSFKLGAIISAVALLCLTGAFGLLLKKQ